MYNDKFNRARTFDACSKQAPSNLAARITSGVRSCSAHADVAAAPASALVVGAVVSAIVDASTSFDEDEVASAKVEVSDGALVVAAVRAGWSFCAWRIDACRAVRARGTASTGLMWYIFMMTECEATQ